MKTFYFFMPISLLTLATLTSCGNDKKSTPVVNTAPLAMSANVTTHADTAYNGTLSATDIDKDALTFSVTAQPANGSVMLNKDGSFVYTPNADTTGTDTFSFVANDGKNVSNTADINITIDLLPVTFSEYSRKLFEQTDMDNPLPLDSRNMTQDVSAETAYDDLLPL